MKMPLVSINIPTWNSEKTLAKCLDAIENQTYKRYEIIIIDSNSKDNTIKIAKKYNCKIVHYNGKLLGARYLGAKKSKGEFVLLLDSDQILKSDALERMIKKIGSNDMLVLEEFTYKPKTWIQKLFEADRKLVHKVKDLNPYTSVLLPRFYRTIVLLRALENIPKILLPKVAGQDHAIIYFEVYKISKKTSILPNAVYHIEPATLIEVIRKNYRWGKTSRDLIKIEEYGELIQRKTRFRKGMFELKNIKLGLQSTALLIIKGVPYKIGYLKRILSKK